MKRNLLFSCFIALALFLPATTFAQCLNCGTGVDGAYTATSNTTLAGGTYNFTTFTINSGVTVSVTGSQALVIRCTGAVNINGTLTAQGGNGTDGVTFSSAGLGGIGVAGGSNGGNGSFASGSGPLSGVAGSGTGGAGNQGEGWSGGGGAGYAAAGNNSGGVGGFGGPAYGNPQISPLVAGSGGGGGSGGYDCGAGGGGAGGGIIIISACGNITIGSGAVINANGGNGGSDGTGNCGGGGGGSGGSIWLSANTISNSGSITAVGGTGGASAVSGTPYYGTGANGSVGRIRVDGIISGNVATPAAVAGTVLTATAASSTAVYCSTQGSALVSAANGNLPYSYLWSNGAITAGISVSTGGNYTVTVTDNSGCEATTTVTIADNTITLTGSVATTDVLCNGGNTGSAEAIVTNGNAPYGYAWSPTGGTGNIAGNLTAGAYTVSVTDADGCTGTFSNTVLQPAALTATAIADSVNCYGESSGSITLNISGGVPTYTVNWSGGLNGTPITGLVAGNYGYTVSDFNNCTLTGQTVVGQPEEFVLDIDVTDVTCEGGSDGILNAVVVSGGVGQVTYLWSTFSTTQSITGLEEGQYNVVGSDNTGCQATANATVDYVYALPVVDLGSDVAQCGGQVSLDAQNSGSSYSWSNGATTQTITVSQTGTMGVTVTNGNVCTATDAIAVTINTIPVVDLGADVTQCGGQVGLDAQNNGSSYLWYDGSTTQTVSVTSANIVSVTVTDANTCTATDEVDVTINAIPVVDLGADVTQCGGTVSLDAQNAGATYSWSDGSTTQTINVTVTGTAEVTVTDANTCTASDEVDVTINTIPIVDLGANVTQCGGQVSLDAQNAGSSYLWSDGSTTQTLIIAESDTLSVTVTDANTCTASDEVEVIISTTMTTSGTIHRISCFGADDAFIDLTVFGGVLPYYFEWSDGSNGSGPIGSLGPGSYAYTITDGVGCELMDAIVLTEPDPLTIDLTVTNVTCQGGSDGVVAAATTGGTGTVTYLWTNFSTDATVANLIADTITVIAVDSNGCQVADTAIVGFDNVTPVLTFNLANELCAGVVEALTASPSGGVFSGNGVSGGNLTVGQAGTQYVVTYAYTDVNGCGAAAADTTTSVICEGINETSAGLSLTVYPNPSNGSFIIATETGIDADVAITNQLGQTVSVFALNRINNYEVAVANMAAGTYFVTCKTTNAVVSKKILILN